ncbi:unnamed protein product, partial [Prorocentrum cordatum]
GILKNDRRDELLQTLAEEIKQLKDPIRPGLRHSGQGEGRGVAARLQQPASAGGPLGEFCPGPDPPRRWGGDLASEVSRSLGKAPAAGGFASSSTGGSDNGLPWGPRPTQGVMNHSRDVHSPQGVALGAPGDSRWAPEPAQLARYGAEFEALDEDRDGFVEGRPRTPREVGAADGHAEGDLGARGCGLRWPPLPRRVRLRHAPRAPVRQRGHRGAR